MRHLSLLFLFVFTALLSQAQDFQWVRSWPGIALSENGNASAAAPAGYSYQAGQFDGILQIGTFSLTSPGYNQYIAQFDPSGNVTWVVPFSGGSCCPSNGWDPPAHIRDVESDALGNVYITGLFYDGVTIGPYSLTGPSEIGDLYVAKLDASGNVLWAKLLSSADYKDIENLSVDGTGNLYMSGFAMYYTLTFGGQAIPTGNGDRFLIKVDSNGGIIWSKRFQHTHTMAAKPNGELYISATSNGPVNLGNGVSLPSAGTYVAYLSSSGQAQWIQSILGGSRPQIKVDPSGDAILMGLFQNSMSYNGNVLQGGNGTKDMYLIKVNSNGTFVWSTGIQNFGGLIIGNGYSPIPKLDVDLGGNPVVAHLHKGTVTFNPSVSYTPADTMHNILVAKYRFDGSLMWYQTVHNPFGTIVTGLSAKDNIDLQGWIGHWGIGTSITQFGSISLTTPDMENFAARIRNDGNLISGIVFIDQNGSGIREAGEPGVPYIRLQLQNGQSFYTNATGEYIISTDTGTYLITLPQVPANYAVNPSSNTAAFSSIGLSDTANHFALQPQSNVSDVSIDVVQLNTPRPGFPYKTRIVYKNMGTTVTNGIIKLLPDSLLVFQSAIPSVTATSGDTLIWNFTSLQPFETRHILIEAGVPVTAPLGSIITITASINPLNADQAPNDNSQIITDTIQGSFDPNDKLVSHRIITPAQVAAGKWLTYTVRFQNTGTDTAFFAVVRDELSPLLDMNTLEVISASHPFTMELTGPTSVEWDFATILLPDSNTNEPASHGYIQYRIKPLTTLTLGQHINTHANICFDFNAPVMTNVTDTEVGVVTVVSNEVDNPVMMLYPNPASTSTTLTYSLPIGAQQSELSVQELSTGKTVRQYALKVGISHQELELMGLANGMYAVVLRINGKAIQVQKLVVIE